ncbi:dTDP-4-dehydrorhamnose 3,5-epimerase [Psychroserpens ponticola]|uniref:dTDP-4-dehydrorhamnose 3,5-epimerase n=1 Tax=Psychroserpens ponticola TaxID=2932268 RepID=A0ABY7RY59_9FLAO|nr:dTDP-4-dehydrorhamnose 3,5-epimerase [Psychroserpens ponticola]WCO01655.1 dTDP-4-dehydrorhamnose 3,5-epimerase [Psychroserpens ponticola]
MIVEQTQLEGCFIISPKVFLDDRGYFFESFNRETFKHHTGVSVDFVQDNQSKSSKGVLRGLHFQTGDFQQAKLVTVISGSVLDVSVDIRPNSPTFGKHFSIVLNETNKKQLFIPRGFAHGFLVLEDDTIFSYKCDNYYNKSAERGIIYNDHTLNIDWHFKTENLILSEKDTNLPTFESLFA